MPSSTSQLEYLHQTRPEAAKHGATTTGYEWTARGISSMQRSNPAYRHLFIPESYSSIRIVERLGWMPELRLTPRPFFSHRYTPNGKWSDSPKPAGAESS